jgi:glycosyltransferase involved in cell wall biosynthesis
MSACRKPDNRVLFLLPDLAFGGAERVTLNLLRYLAETPLACALFSCGTSTEMLDEVPAGVRLYTGVDSSLRMRQAFPRLVKKLRPLVGSYDIIVATSPHTTALMQGAAIGKKVRKLSWIHFNAESFLPRTTGMIRTVSRIAYPLTHERIFVSDGVRSSFGRRLGAKAGDGVIHNIFDPRSYARPSRVASEVAMLKATGKPVLGVVSRLVEGKGLNDMLALHKTLLRKGYDHHIAVIGEGPLKLDLAHEIQQQQLQHSLHLLGQDPSPLEAMRMFDLMLLTSEHEAWPTVVLESFYAQVPIVSFSCPTGPAEMLTGPLASCLVPGRDIHAFVDTIFRANQLRTELVGAGLQRLQHFSPQNIVPAWLELLTKDH